MAADKSADINKANKPLVFEICNDCGMKTGFTNIGASITDIIVADRNGRFENVVLKHNDPEDYWVNENYLGATIGRYANRIADGSICNDGRRYSLSLNEKEANNHLHGGYKGFSRKAWAIKSKNNNSITFQYISPDGEECYPGNLIATVAYKLDNNNCLSVEYGAVTDKPTIINLTNHSYFNLSGGTENIFNHTLCIAASEYTPLDERNLPLGYKNSVKDTIYDVQKETKICSIAASIINTNYCIENKKGLTKAAILRHYTSGRRMAVYATMPGLQLYFGNYLSGNQKPYDGICLEPQYYPDAPNIPAFGYAWLQKDKAYKETILYHFDPIR